MDTTTTPVSGTDYAVTYEIGRYSDVPVWLHPADAPYWQGRIIGTVGHLVRHGAFAVGGTVDPARSNRVVERQFTSPHGQHLSASQAVDLLARWAIGSQVVALTPEQEEAVITEIRTMTLLRRSATAQTLSLAECGPVDAIRVHLDRLEAEGVVMRTPAGRYQALMRFDEVTGETSWAR